MPSSSLGRMVESKYPLVGEFIKDTENPPNGWMKEALEYLLTETMNQCDLEWNILDKDKTISWGVTTLIPEARIENGVCSTRIVHS